MDWIEKQCQKKKHKLYEYQHWRFYLTLWIAFLCLADSSAPPLHTPSLHCHSQACPLQHQWWPEKKVSQRSTKVASNPYDVFPLESIKCTQSIYIYHVRHQLPCVQFSNCKNGKTAQGIDYLLTCASSNHRNYDSIFTTGSEATWNLDTSKQRKYVLENEWTVRAVPTRKHETMQLSWTCSKNKSTYSHPTPSHAVWLVWLPRNFHAFHPNFSLTPRMLWIFISACAICISKPLGNKIKMDTPPQVKYIEIKPFIDSP